MSNAIPIQPRSSKGFIMLPQAPEEAGYYVYGNVNGVPGTGPLAQYAHPDLMSMIFHIEREWQAIEDRKFGIGNISLADGSRFDHATHRKGIEVDCRPVRKDKMVGDAARCSRFDAIYDRSATLRLIRLFAAYPLTNLIYFNDDAIQHAIGAGIVTSRHGHDDHFHVQIKVRS
nr:hypothetical protein [uncultured Duganella sp.]